eukprot:CAMPEP_0172821170 /NCGR_PEP_ID=MMETSP1075-20121228/15761_1 /TAXON_ID=2916 /ORGANISM="Ceratium fusus, Strain PA161109" /LENGTH=498 /DNA_ID=CAMNT_0013661957 /DNA_START=15 /DNA_END=1511 /DNA_ORIENTATION=-
MPSSSSASCTRDSMDPEPGSVSGFDVLPGFAHAKIAYLWAVGDEEAVATTWENYTTYSVVASQVRSTYEVAIGEPMKAFDRQRQFVKSATQTLAALPETVPVLGHVIAVAQSCSGNRRSKHTAKKATRSCSVLMAGSAVWAVAPTTMPLTTVGIAGLTGVAAGIAADRLLFGQVPRPLSNAQNFDIVALRVLDMIRAIGSFHACVLLAPSHVTEVSVWVQPITLAEMSKLVEVYKHLPDRFSEMPTPALHAYMLIKTSNGGLFVTEKMHNGHVLVENLTSGITHYFQDGHELGNTILAHATNKVNPLHDHVAAHAATKADPLAPLPLEVDGARLFASYAVKHGPPTAVLSSLAESQSLLQYDVFRANCQHYVATGFNTLSGSRLVELPNENLLALAKSWAVPEEAPLVPQVTLPATLYWSLREGLLANPRLLPLEAMLIFLPVESLASVRSRPSESLQRKDMDVTDHEESTDNPEDWQDQFASSLRRRMVAQEPFSYQ